MQKIRLFYAIGSAKYDNLMMIIPFLKVEANVKILHIQKISVY